MAYLPASQKTEQERDQQGQNPAQPAALPSSSAGGGEQAAPAAFATPQAAAPAAQPQQSTTPYPMITDYLRANQGAGKSMASEVSNAVGGQVTAAQDQANRARTDWTNQNQTAVDQWRQTVNDNYARDVDNLARIKAQTDAGLESQSAAWGVLNPADRRRYIENQYRMARENYVPDRVADPNLTAYYTPEAVTQAQRDATARLGALGSEAGRSALLAQRYNGAGPYRGGAAALDSALVGQDNPEGALRAQYGDIINALTASPAAIDLQRPEEPWQMHARWDLPDPAGIHGPANPTGIYRNE